MSLPDILGACMVTRAETHADEAMIHIAGSIAVKVLMGVGLPWFIAALYHYLNVNIFFNLMHFNIIYSYKTITFVFIFVFRETCLKFHQLVLVLMFFYILLWRF